MLFDPAPLDDPNCIVSAMVVGLGSDLEPWWFAITPLGAIAVVYCAAVETPEELEDKTREMITLRHGEMWKALRHLKGMNPAAFTWN